MRGSVLATRDGTVRRAEFDALVREHSEAVWRYARAMLGDPRDADEATQDTFLKVHRGLDGFRGDAAVRTWILAICRNACLDRLRRVARPADSLDALRAEGYEPVDHTDIASATATQRAIAVTLPRLAPEEREAFVLVDVLGLTASEAATTCDVPPTTLRSRLQRAHAALVDQLLRGDA